MTSPGAPVLRPELMAIGDSVYNGVRSLTIDANLAELSVPAQVAHAFDWDFVSPDYPRNVLLNFEQLMRQPALFLGLRGMIIDNVNAWLDNPNWSSFDGFDNIAIAQSVITDLTSFTYLDHLSQIRTLLNKLENESSLDVNDLANLYMALNGSFLLNPRNDTSLSVGKMSPVDIVGLRRPKRLLVNVGVNDGIWTICLEASKDQFKPDEIFAHIQTLGTKLLALRTSGAVDRIYFNSLPKPSTVANLMPPRNPRSCPDGSGYYPYYVGRLGMQGGLTGAEVSQLDNSVADLNSKIRGYLTNLFSAIGGFEFVDIFATMAAQDAKHCRETTPIVVKNGRTGWHLTNLPLQSPSIVGGFTYGGLFGLDNMHPTTIGYAMLARAVCDQISTAEKISVPNPISFQEAFDEDTLLRDVPALVDAEDFFVDLLAAFVSQGTS